MLACLGSGGCGGRQVISTASPAPPGANHLVYVADGAGNIQNCSRNLRLAAAEECRPLHLITFDWNHGKRRYFQDHLDYDNIQAKGCQLATILEAQHRIHPQTPIFLVGYSAGCGVILEAMEHLPPGTVERVFLMSPSLSACHELGPALPAVKTQVHVHYSYNDWWWMGVTTSILGSTDRRWGPTAARFGFQTDPDMAGKVCQRAWQWSDIQDGNNGGHFGIYGHAFLRQHVLSYLP